MERKVLFLLIFIGLVELGCVMFYDYARLWRKYDDVAWIMHICILSFDIAFVLIYVLLYRAKTYSVFVLLALIFFLLGDVFVQIYAFPFENFIDNPAGYIALAGSCYFIARIILTVIFALKDKNYSEIVEVDKKVLMFCHFLFTLPYLAFGITFLCLNPSYISTIIFLYLFLSFGFLQSYALIRMVKGKGRLCLISISLLNSSHILLLSLAYNKAIPFLMKLIATNIYWLSMFLLALSVISPPIPILYTPIEEF